MLRGGRWRWRETWQTSYEISTAKPPVFTKDRVVERYSINGVRPLKQLQGRMIGEKQEIRVLYVRVLAYIPIRSTSLGKASLIGRSKRQLFGTYSNRQTCRAIMSKQVFIAVIGMDILLLLQDGWRSPPCTYQLRFFLQSLILGSWPASTYKIFLLTFTRSWRGGPSLPRPATLSHPAIPTCYALSCGAKHQMPLHFRLQPLLVDHDLGERSFRVGTASTDRE